MLTVVKLLISAGIIYLINEVVITRSRPMIGSMIAALPLVSIITLVWIWFGKKDQPEDQVERLATYSVGVFWFVLPSLPMFLLFPWFLRKGIPFWGSLGICCVITMVLFFITAVVLKRFGMQL